MIIYKLLPLRLNAKKNKVEVAISEVHSYIFLQDKLLQEKTQLITDITDVIRTNPKHMPTIHRIAYPEVY